MGDGHIKTMQATGSFAVNIRSARDLMFEVYQNFRDELSINNDLLMKGEQVVIPTSCRDSIMEDLH